MADLKTQPEEYWQEKLTPEQYQVCRMKGTEAPFSGIYVHNEKDGMYQCVACGEPLFSSETKYDSGSGWPSFWEAIDKSKLELHEDHTLGVTRTEVTCKNCGAHLGHVFPDGPEPTGQRYCINSVALKFDTK